MLDFQQNISEKKSPQDRFSESLFSIPYNESGTPSQGVITNYNNVRQHHSSNELVKIP